MGLQLKKESTLTLEENRILGVCISKYRLWDASYQFNVAFPDFELEQFWSKLLVSDKGCQYYPMFGPSQTDKNTTIS